MAAHFFAYRFHAAFAKLSGIGNPSAIHLNSSGNVSYLSTTIVEGHEVSRSGGPLSLHVTGLSAGKRKRAVDKPVTSGLFLACSGRLQRESVIRLTPAALACATMELASYSARD